MRTSRVALYASACASTNVPASLTGDVSCKLYQATDRMGVAVGLGPLAANGGPTRTHLLAAGNPAIDRIPADTLGVCDATTPIDQRGVARPAGSGCDAGAVEGATAAVPGEDVPVEPAAPPLDPDPATTTTSTTVTTTTGSPGAPPPVVAPTVGTIVEPSRPKGS